MKVASYTKMTNSKQPEVIKPYPKTKQVPNLLDRLGFMLIYMHETLFIAIFLARLPFYLHIHAICREWPLFALRIHCMRQTYGKTFWGQQWLNAFNGIDYSNRLPRGRTYANKGAVFDIEIKGLKFNAKVHGSRRTPYKIQFEQRPFTTQEQQDIVETFKTSPSMFSKLMSREIPESLLTSLASQNIQLFPSDWQDIHAHCNCPDWAVPCKHLAAGIYLMANRIDQNPFLVFENRGFDLLKTIQAQGLLTRQETIKIPTLKDRLHTSSPFDDDYNTDDYLKRIEQSIDFSNMPNISDRLQILLKDNPPFSVKNFKPVLFDVLNAGRRYAEKVPNEKVPASLDIDAPEQLYHTENIRHLHVVINDQHSAQKLFDDRGRLFESKELALHSHSIEGILIDVLSMQQTERLQQNCLSIRFLHLMNRFVFKLLSQQAIVPEISDLGKQHWLIRWLPALFDEAISNEFTKLVALCPEQWLSLKTKTAFLTRYQQTLTTCSLFIGEHLRRGQLLSKKLRDPDALARLFFQSQPVSFDAFDQQDTPDAIAQWLSRLSASKNNRFLQLQAKEAGDDFAIGLQVGERDNKKRAIALKTFLKNADKKGSLEAKDKPQVLADLALLSDYLPEMTAVIDNPKNTTLSVDLDNFAPILMQIMPALKVLGMHIALPKSLQKLLKPQLKMALTADESLKSEKTYLNLDKLLDFDWQIALGDQTLNMAEFKQLLQDSKGLVRLMDGYVLLDEQEVEQLLKQLDKLPETLSSAEFLQASLSGEFEGAEVAFDKHIEGFLDNLMHYKPVKPPKALNAKLRPYQASGFSWMVQNANCGFGSLLADDMGLGKTLQVIAVLLHFKKAGALTEKKVLVVAPTSLLSNWQKEMEKFAPDLSTHVYHGLKRELANDTDVLITSYGLARRDKAKLNALKLHALVIDEAQQIKNPQTAQTKSIKAIDADYRIAMSGTPVENHLMEYWSLFDFTNAGYLGKAKDFKKAFANPIENDRDLQCLGRFQKMTSPFILRRLKSDKSIIQDLPEKIETDVICNLTKEQTALYQQVVEHTLQNIEDSEGIERKGLVFKLINALKQICNHPSQYLKEPSALIEQSGKLATTCELLTNISEQNEKTLIFTQYAQMGDLLAEVLSEKLGQNVPFLHGKLPIKKRDQLVYDFQHEPQLKTLIISLKAGGTGLNLTAANHVIHYDLWWNPAVEAQATDRAYRIGQQKNVQVHRLITEGTFEEKINTMINDKKALADLSVASGETWITEFNNTELKQLFTI